MVVRIIGSNRLDLGNQVLVEEELTNVGSVNVGRRVGVEQGSVYSDSGGILVVCEDVNVVCSTWDFLVRILLLHLVVDGSFRIPV